MKRFRIFNYLFNAGNKEKALVYKSRKFGSIYTTELQKFMKQDDPYFMVPLKDIAEDKNEMGEFENWYYAFATFMPPGESKAIVSYGDIEDKDSYNMLENAIPIREEEVRKQLVLLNIDNFTWKENKEVSLCSPFSKINYLCSEIGSLMIKYPWRHHSI